jgi:hypothetical protein
MLLTINKTFSDNYTKSQNQLSFKLSPEFEKVFLVSNKIKKKFFF